MNNPNTKRIIAMLTVTSILAGCADHPEKIPAQYISPMQYDSYNCKQISAEMQRVSSRVGELGGQQKKAAENSDVAMGVGLILFWPALFFLDSHSAQAAEYGRLKGEFNALEQAGIQKNCGLKIERPKLPEPEKKDDKTPEYPSGSRNR
jgi:hypothetical protein